MKVLSIAVVALALALAAGAVTAQAGNSDDCHTKTAHGIWDCR
jgi:hypothetical protein